MRNTIESFFKLKDLNTNIRTEVTAGITTFTAMAYIIFVNPAMISQTGMDFGAAMMATCISAAVATILERLYRIHPVISGDYYDAAYF